MADKYTPFRELLGRVFADAESDFRDDRLSDSAYKLEMLDALISSINDSGHLFTNEHFKKD